MDCMLHLSENMKFGDGLVMEVVGKKGEWRGICFEVREQEEENEGENEVSTFYKITSKLPIFPSSISLVLTRLNDTVVYNFSRTYIINSVRDITTNLSYTS